MVGGSPAHRSHFAPLVAGVAFVLLLAGCGGSSATNTPASSGATGGSPVASGGGASASTFSAAKGCKHVAFLSPDTTAGGRWEAYDHPLTEASVKAALPGVTFDAVNAQNSTETQLTQASSELTKGACILIVVAVDSTSAAAIVQKAKASKVPVIAYDRLIQDNDLAYYATFDNVKVGETQAQYIKDHHKKGDNVAMINGSQTDNNALLFAQGAHNILDPLFASGELHKVYEQYTPMWVAATAQTEMAAALTANNNPITRSLTRFGRIWNSPTPMLTAITTCTKNAEAAPSHTENGLPRVAITSETNIDLSGSSPMKTAGKTVAMIASRTAMRSNPARSAWPPEANHGLRARSLSASERSCSKRR